MFSLHFFWSLYPFEQHIFLTSDKSLNKNGWARVLWISIFSLSKYFMISLQFELPSSSEWRSFGFFPIFCSPSIKPADTSGGCLLLVGIRVAYWENIWIKTRPILNSCWLSKSLFDMKKSSWNSKKYVAQRTYFAPFAFFSLQQHVLHRIAWHLPSSLMGLFCSLHQGFQNQNGHGIYHIQSLV